MKKPTDTENTGAAQSLTHSDLLAVAEWLTGDDTGVSSKYMASVAIAGSALKSRWGDSTPSDAPDLGRCVRLIEKAPTVRSCFPILRQASPVWAAYVDHWDELTTLWHQGDYHVTTDRMRDLRSSANAKDEREERVASIVWLVSEGPRKTLVSKRVRADAHMGIGIETLQF
jgi:hypothetical protein